MAGTKLKLLLDENASGVAQVHVKNLTGPTNEATKKRAALGDLQNRGIPRTIITKDAVQKELKDIKLPNTLRNAKARVDTHWKKQPLATNNANANANSNISGKSTAAGPLLRSNSVRNVAALPTLRQATANVQQPAKTATLANVKATAVDASSNVAAKLKSSSEELNAAGITTNLRREDSNLSRKSLTKLRAAMAKPAGTTKVAIGTTAAIEKKEPVTKKEPITANLPMVRQPKLRSEPVQSTVSLSTRRLMGIDDIDADDTDNLMLVSEYVKDIYNYLYQVETQQPIHVDHLAGQLEVSTKMRAVLVDWINEVHLQFHLAAETFQMAVAIIDRYLQVVKNTKRSYLQLVGVTALFIATKYEELFPPAIGDFVFITDNTYTARQIRMMELQVLKAIDCNLSRPLPIHFLRRYSKAADAEDQHHAMSKYFLELASMEYELTSYKPSEIAAASLFLSLHLINGNAKAGTGFNDKHWTPTLAYYSRYTAAHLRPITKRIAKLARDAPQSRLRSVYSKYQTNKFQKIALRPELSGALLDSIAGSKK